MLSSCNTKPEGHPYYVIQVKHTEDLLKDLGQTVTKADTIFEVNDSIAYFKAFTKFVIAQKVYSNPKYSKFQLDAPTSFRLFDENGIELHHPTYRDMDSLEAKIRKDIMGIDTQQNNGSLTAATKKDPVKSKSLSNYFVFKKDEFDPDGVTWCTPKSAPKFTNRNGLYCYFQIKDDQPSNLRFRMQYVNDDWLFIDRIQFLIDGTAYEFKPEKVEQDNGEGGIWEWYDQGVSYLDRDLIMALSDAKVAKMKIIGSQYFDIRPITKNQIASIKTTLELYNAMGGDY